MSTRYVCDYAGCDRPATYRLTATAIWQVGQALVPDQLSEHSIETCNFHYEFTHPGKGGGGWWDDFSAPQQRGKRHRDDFLKEGSA